MASSSGSAHPQILTADRAQVLEAVGVRVRVLVTAEDSGGTFSLLEYTAPAGFAGPQPHWHERTAELFYVLDGSLEVLLDGAPHVLAPGDRVLVPTRTVHGFRNPGQEPARFLVHATPGGLERYFVELVELIRAAPSWPLPDMRPVAVLAERHDTFAPPADHDT